LKGKIFYVAEHVRARTTLEISWRPAGGPRPPPVKNHCLRTIFYRKTPDYILEQYRKTPDYI